MWYQVLAGRNTAGRIYEQSMTKKITGERSNLKLILKGPKYKKRILLGSIKQNTTDITAVKQIQQL